MTPGARFLLRRIGQSLITVLLIVIVNFAILHAAPGDAVDVLAGESGSSDPEVLARMRAHLGLDRPLPVQFLTYMARLFTFDLGTSLQNQERVLTLILGRLPATLLLMIPSLVLAFLIGVGLGVLSARRVHGMADTMISLFALAAYAMPLFWLGLMLIVLFTLKLGLLPSNGIATIGVDLGWWGGALDVLRHMVMPVLTLSLFYTATYARLMRASMLEVSRANFVRTARAKGLREGRVTWRHVVRNALLPIVTMLGLHVGAILGGAVVVEVVFGWPGLGSLAFDAVFRRDNTVLLGLLFFCSLLVVAVNLLIDLLYRWLDPRVELGAAR